MINNVDIANTAHIIGANPSQNQTNTSSSSQQHSAASGGRVIEDKIDFSPAAKETLEQHNKARKEEQNKLVDEIMEKGFLSWADEKYREKLEAEVRSQVLRSLGMDEKDYAQLEPEVQQRIEEIIQQKMREKMEEKLAEDAKKNNTRGTTSL